MQTSTGLGINHAMSALRAHSWDETIEASEGVNARHAFASWDWHSRPTTSARVDTREHCGVIFMAISLAGHTAEESQHCKKNIPGKGLIQ